eukprot:scaffold20364_cov112-Isochrysis_galbana.AAC.7
MLQQEHVLVQPLDQVVGLIALALSGFGDAVQRLRAAPKDHLGAGERLFHAAHVLHQVAERAQ